MAVSYASHALYTKWQMSQNLFEDFASSENMVHVSIPFLLNPNALRILVGIHTFLDYNKCSAYYNEKINQVKIKLNGLLNSNTFFQRCVYILLTWCCFRAICCCMKAGWVFQYKYMHWSTRNYFPIREIYWWLSRRTS